MISVYNIKPTFQKLLQPILRVLHNTGITPNLLTIVSILLSALLAIMLYLYQSNSIFLLLVPFGLLLRMALNALDGMMARQFNMQSKTGEMLNEIGDIISDVIIIVALLAISELQPLLLIAFIILTMLNEFAGLLGKAMGGNRRYEGPMGKSDRALLIGQFCIGLYIWPLLVDYSNWIFSIACILLCISTFIRLKKSVKGE